MMPHRATPLWRRAAHGRASERARIRGNRSDPLAALSTGGHRNPNKLVLCRGPDLNRRHMVLQVTSPAIPRITPRGRDDTWLQAIANGSTRWTASRHFRPLAQQRSEWSGAADLEPTPPPRCSLANFERIQTKLFSRRQRQLPIWFGTGGWSIVDSRCSQVSSAQRTHGHRQQADREEECG